MMRIDGQERQNENKQADSPTKMRALTVLLSVPKPNPQLQQLPQKVPNCVARKEKPVGEETKKNIRNPVSYLGVCDQRCDHLATKREKRQKQKHGDSSF